jgi:hypothetical protein
MKPAPPVTTHFAELDIDSRRNFWMMPPVVAKHYVFGNKPTTSGRPPRAAADRGGNSAKIARVVSGRAGTMAASGPINRPIAGLSTFAI